MNDQVSYESVDSVAVITIRRPERRNALSVQVVEGLRNAWSRFEEGSDRCAVLTSEGDSFCAGMDLDSAISDISAAVPGLRRPLTKPVVAAVKGYAIGAGYVLAHHCDLAVAADNTVFRYPEAKLGLFGGLGAVGSSRIPHKFAMEMMLLGSDMSANRAHDVGLVNAVVEAGAELDLAMEWAGTIRKSAPLVVRAMKALGDDQTEQSSITAHIRVKELLEVIYESEDRERGITAMKEKTTPDFQGD